MEQDFEELHRLINQWSGLIQNVYRIEKKRGKLNVYDILNAAKITEFLRREQSDASLLEKGNIDLSVLNERFILAFKIVRGQKLQNDYPEFCDNVQRVLNRAKRILMDSEQESSYLKWLSAKEENLSRRLPEINNKPINQKPDSSGRKRLPDVINKSVDPNSDSTSQDSSGQKRLPDIINKPIPHREPSRQELEELYKRSLDELFEEPPSNEYKKINQWNQDMNDKETQKRLERNHYNLEMETNRSKAAISNSIRSTIYFLITFAILFFGIGAPTISKNPGLFFPGLILISLSIVSAIKSHEKNHEKKKIAYRINYSYSASINTALSASSPNEIIFEITEALRELEQYGLCHEYEIRWQESYSESSQYSSTSWSENVGNPNITRLKEIIEMSHQLALVWVHLSQIERYRAMDEVRGRLERERINMALWIIRYRLTIKNMHIPPRYIWQG